jgi:hypothetical protein
VLLMTDNIKVDQFYSGLALSAILAPAAILTRKMSNYIGLLHPFAIAARNPVKSADLDRMMDPGLLAIKATLPYSWWHALVQIVLMLAGALLVPIGTLLVTTGDYAPQTAQNGVVGLPTARDGIMIMSISMAQPNYSSNSDPSLLNYGTVGDFFMTMVSEKFKSIVIDTFALLSEAAPYLGPVPTTNITYEDGVIYNGVVAYQWESGCEPTEDIQYTVEEESAAWIVNFTFPDGSMTSTDAWETRTYIWSDSQHFGSAGIPIGGSTYFAATDAISETVSIPQDTSGLVFVNGTWISLVKCTPSIQWSVSSCLWNGTAMTSCYATPDKNTTALDMDGLDLLSGYMSAVVWAIQLGDEFVFRNQMIDAILVDYPGRAGHQHKAPALSDYDNLYGAVAESIATITTIGYYGTATVPTIGQPSKPVYIVRIYILAILVAVFVTVTLVCVLDLVYHVMNHIPLRPATFLTIANAVRGPWWDRELFGGCAMDVDALRKKHRTRVMFGVDIHASQHVGLATSVSEIDNKAKYYGVQEVR